MRKNVAAVRLVDRDEATEAVELPEELRLSLGAIAGVAREGAIGDVHHGRPGHDGRDDDRGDDRQGRRPDARQAGAAAGELAWERARVGRAGRPTRAGERPRGRTIVAELPYLHSRDITYAVFCQGPYDESIRYHDFMGWDMPWYSARASLDALLAGPAATPGVRRWRPTPRVAAGEARFTT